MVVTDSGSAGNPRPAQDVGHERQAWQRRQVDAETLPTGPAPDAAHTLRPLPVSDPSRQPPQRVHPRARLGDRVERVLEERADAEREIERGEAETPGRAASISRTAFWLGITGISLYLVAPSLIDVFGSVDELHTIQPGWLPVLFVLQALGLAFLWVGAAARAARPAVATGDRVAAGRQRPFEDRAGWRRDRGGAAVSDAGRGGDRTRSRGGRDHRGQPAHVRGRARPAGAGAAGVHPRRRQPRPGRGDADRRRRVRRAPGARSDDARVRRAAELGRPPGAGRAQQAAARGRAAAHAAGAPAPRARPAARHARPPLEGGDRCDGRPLGIRLRDPAGRPRGGRLDSATGARAARLLRRAGARAGAGDTGRAGLRRGRPHRDARPGRGGRLQRRAGDIRLPCSRIGCRCRSGSVAFALHRRRLARAS